MKYLSKKMHLNNKISDKKLPGKMLSMKQKFLAFRSGFSLGASTRAFIPAHVSNKVLLGFLEGLRSRNRSPRKDFQSHEKANEEAIRKNHLSMIRKNRGFIEDQQRYSDLSLGVTDMAYAGCEIIALYNALHEAYNQRNLSPDLTSSWTGDPAKDLSGLISRFEQDGILLSGRFGTSIRAVWEELKNRGFTSQLIPFSTPQWDERELSPGNIYLLYYYNNGRNIMDQIHTICITRNPDGCLVAHNLSGSKASRPAQTIREILINANQSHAKGIALIIINN